MILLGIFCSMELKIDIMAYFYYLEWIFAYLASYLLQDISPECFFAGVCCGGLITLPIQVIELLSSHS